MTVGVAMSEGPHSAADCAEVERCGLGPLMEAPLFAGGDIIPRSNSFFDQLRWLHTLGPTLPGAKEIAPSVWQGGDLQVAAELVQSGKVELSRLRPIRGYAGWSLRQLEIELERGVWARFRALPVETSRLGVGNASSQRLCFSTSAEDLGNLWRTAA